MSKYLVFGHKNPDTDAIGSAIAFSYFLEKLGHEAEAVALGEPNGETSFALSHFQIEAPRVVKTVANEVERVALVDHNEPIQSVDDIESVEVDYVVDHHRIANFQTANPLFYRAEPLGCTATVLYKMFNEYQFDIPRAIAGMMLSAIISDTLLFQSPTCTSTDKDVAHELARLIDIDVQSYGIDLLKAGADLASKTDLELINGDAKNFEMGEKLVRIGQINAIGFDDILARKDSIIDAMNAEVSAHAYNLFLLVITDILESNSIGFVAGADYTIIETAFNHPVSNYQVDLPGIVSRKKQVVPPLTEAYQQ